MKQFFAQQQSNTGQPDWQNFVDMAQRQTSSQGSSLLCYY